MNNEREHYQSFKSNLLTFEKKTSKQPEENKTQTSEISTNISSKNENQTQNNETKKINLEPTKHTRISECGNTYNIYKAVDLSNENSIPIPKSMPLLQNYMKSLLGEIVKRKSIEYREEEEREKQAQEKKVEEETHQKQTNDQANSNSWRVWLNSSLVEVKLMKKVMILSQVGDLWATTDENFKLSNKEQMEKIKTLMINHGICYGDCICVTKGIPIGNNYYRLNRYDSEYEMLDLNNCFVYLRHKVCLIGEKDESQSDPIPKIASIVEMLNTYLESY